MVYYLHVNGVSYFILPSSLSNCNLRVIYVYKLGKRICKYGNLDRSCPQSYTSDAGTAAMILVRAKFSSRTSRAQGGQRKWAH